MEPTVLVKNIYKTFPGVKALNGVTLGVWEGVHAIVGENGAGKSTLMKILGGVYTPDSGEIFIHGKEANIRSVKDSLKAGIGIIYQEFNLMPELTVAENIFINDLPKMKMVHLLKIKTLKKRALELMDRLSLNIDPMKLVKDLSVHERQMVEICKALSYNSSIIIMDEPTAALNEQEVNRLFRIIRKLKEEKKTILYISHRLKEIFEVADRVTVLRDGMLVGTENIGNVDKDKVVRMMVGRDIGSYYHQVNTEPGDVLLSVRSLTKSPYFKDITFDLRKGEILGISGLMGCGREELAKAIYGLINFDGGEIYLGGKKTKIKKPVTALKNKIAFVTEDRKEAGIFPEMTVRENITLTVIKKLTNVFKTFINFKDERELLTKYTKFMNLKYADEFQRIMYLSGGNQQKIVLARALATQCEVLILLEPTRGIDVGAKSEIYNLLGELSRAGIAIIMISAELPELISICHRVLVLWEGTITGNLSKKDMTENNIMQCATGNQKIFSEVV